MFLVREVFKCKPGKAKELVERFKKSMEIFEASGKGRKNRVLVDYISTYWTVVLEVEIEEIGELEKIMQDFGANADVQKVMSGYMDLVEGGRREIFRIA